MKYAVKSLRAKTLAGLVISATLPGLALADRVPDVSNMSKEKGITMGAGAAIGAALGGPAGFAIGTIAGGILGDNAQQTTQLATQEVEMNQAQREIDSLENQVTQMDLIVQDMASEVAQLEEALVTRLEFQVLFRTGDDRLRDQDRERIAMLAKYMRRNPEVNVLLQGHTDARGTDEYNAVLAEYRARAVADALMARGVPGKRLKIESLGSSNATAIPGDYEGYALDRHVNIQVFSENQTEVVDQEDAEKDAAESVALAQ